MQSIDSVAINDVYPHMQKCLLDPCLAKKSTSIFWQIPDSRFLNH